MNRNAFLKLRLERQHLLEPVARKDYKSLFCGMSPVLCTYWSCPGTPPELLYRASFDDRKYCYKLRERREIIKGRFQNGSIAYIYADELELFGSVYCRHTPLSESERELYELLLREGPMTIHVIKEFTGMLTKEITPALHRLQEKFLVFEDQADSEWDRAWYPFETEFPDVDVERYPKAEAVKELIGRFAFLNVWIDAEMVKSFYRLPVKEIRAALEAMTAEGGLLPCKAGYIRTADRELLECEAVCASETSGNGSSEKLSGREPAGAPISEGRSSVRILHRNDFLVKSNEHWLKKKYRHPEYDILGYLLIDGEFNGCLLGHFKNGPFVLEDVGLFGLPAVGTEDCPMLPGEEADGRNTRKMDGAPLREAVISAVEELYDPDESPLKRYMGEALTV